MPIINGIEFTWREWVKYVSTQLLVSADRMDEDDCEVLSVMLANVIAEFGLPEISFEHGVKVYKAMKARADELEKQNRERMEEPPGEEGD